jgi:hypothetical protein
VPLAGPDRTDFPRGVIANRKYEIQSWTAGLGEFIPALAAQSGGGKTSRLQPPDSGRLDTAARVATSAVSREVGLTFLVEGDLRHDGAGGIASAEK